VDIVCLGIQPRQGRKIRRENLTLLPGLDASEKRFSTGLRP
jgi:hypothetical protein